MQLVWSLTFPHKEWLNQENQLIKERLCVFWFYITHFYKFPVININVIFIWYAFLRPSFVSCFQIFNIVYTMYNTHMMYHCQIRFDILQYLWYKKSVFILYLYLKGALAGRHLESFWSKFNMEKVLLIFAVLLVTHVQGFMTSQGKIEHFAILWKMSVVFLSPPLPNVTWHSWTWSYTVTTSFDQTFH